MSVDLYYIPDSYDTQLLLSVLEYLKIEYKPIAVEYEEDKLPEELSRYMVTPKLPAIMHEGFGVGGVKPIIRYLVQDKDIKDQFYPNDDLKKRSSIDAYIEHDQMVYRFNFIPLLKAYEKDSKIFKRDGFRSDEIQELYDKANTSLDVFTEILYRNEGDFILGDQVTLADFCYFYTTKEVIDKFKIDLGKYEENKDFIPLLKIWLKKVRSG
eukprot:CAMPEP_0197009716 /NCGR_PEP_ID=MMETSP1380-20130617/51226_1 /TAXON_ID=5936 /ORGANISM="Euplotes crassus, Strain CT5" /LENGTH=210 /DNA_ID=CAMNT_0042431141 /DNA_START=11 /DNA_END=640 /DNA_ORIENTATION=+